MKTSFLPLAIAVAVIGVPLAFAADPPATPPEGFVSDSQITQLVRTALKEENVNSYSKLQVDTDANGVVWLRGTVESQAEADRAVSIAKHALNVKGVHNQLEVKPAVGAVR